MNKKFTSYTYDGLEFNYWGEKELDLEPIGPTSEYNSELRQDFFVCDGFNYKSNGIFVDIGGAHPILGNNTYTLETKYKWSGISFDRGTPGVCYFDSHATVEEYCDFWNRYRTTPVITGDILEKKLKNVFEKYNLPKTIDYLSIDIKFPHTFQALKLVIESGYNFNLITFETEKNRWDYANNKVHGNEKSRKYMKDNDYILVPNHNPEIEDWYVHNDFYQEYKDNDPYYLTKRKYEEWKSHDKEDKVRYWR